MVQLGGNLGLISGFAASRLRSALGASTTLDASIDARLEKHKTFLEKQVAELSAATLRLIRHYRRDIIDRQQELERLADMAIELFVVESGHRFRASRDQWQSPLDETRRQVARRVRADAGYGVTDALLETRE
jgi:vacuolar-type H+-ATPase subunit I/STV1